MPLVKINQLLIMHRKNLTIFYYKKFINKLTQDEFV